MKFSKKDQELLGEAYLDMYATDSSKANTHQKQRPVSSIIYKNEGGKMGAAYSAALQKVIDSNPSVEFKGKVPKGYGETRPIASNDDEAEGRELNRRTEIKILSK